MIEQLYQFQLDGQPLYCDRYGNGHINDSYLVIDETARQYILQKINKNVFSDPESLMGNIVAVTNHLKKKVHDFREVLTLVPTKRNKNWLVDDDGEHWRLYEFVCNSICMDKAETPEDFSQSAIAFGRFQKQLADFDASILVETIPRFHDTPNRYAALQEAIQNDSVGRVKNAAQEIDFAMERLDYAPRLLEMLSSKEMPLRVTHNDTKLNNVLFDRNTRKALCVIDLDTVMPGLAVNDYGDSIRFGASTAAEDEKDLSKVSMSLELYEAYTAGYLSACKDSLWQSEIESLRDGAKMMTLECGVRFLTDYLRGDTYFHIKYDEQNLDRCRTQFKLVADMESKWDEMQRIVMREAKK